MAGTAPVDDHSSNGTSLLIWASDHARMHGEESGPGHRSVSGRSHHELRARNARYVRERSGFLADRHARWTRWSRWGGQWLRVSRRIRGGCCVGGRDAQLAESHFLFPFVPTVSRPVQITMLIEDQTDPGWIETIRLFESCGGVHFVFRALEQHATMAQRDGNSTHLRILEALFVVGIIGHLSEWFRLRRGFW